MGTYRQRSRRDVYIRKDRKAKIISQDIKEREATKEKILEAIRKDDHQRVISLTASLRSKGLIYGFVAAAEAYAKLGNVEGVERIVKQALEFNYPKSFFTASMSELYYATQNFEKLIDLYLETRSDYRTSPNLFLTMIKYCGITKNYMLGRTVIEDGLKLPNINPHNFAETYIREVIGGAENVSELYAFMKKLHISGIISPVEVEAFLDVLYTRNMFSEVIRYYELYPEELLSVGAKTIYSNAVRKLTI